jgi:hypothetical protein
MAKPSLLAHIFGRLEQKVKKYLTQRHDLMGISAPWLILTSFNCKLGLARPELPSLNRSAPCAF